MAFPMIGTPRYGIDDVSGAGTTEDLGDFQTQSSLPSPLKRREAQTPRSRVPLVERRNPNAKNEFTPLLKSATKNRMAFSRARGKENGVPHTPAALKPGYSYDSPGLPMNSSIILEEQTGSSLGANDEQPTPLPPVSSSSAMSTPVPARQADGLLDNGRNLATLREQEARLAQIDKENFGLKLKIHFMEEALRKNGKDFNEAAIKENTELKVDKITLQRDLKQYRKSLAQAEKDLDDYRNQLLDYAEKVKRRHVSEGIQEEMDKLRQETAQKDSDIGVLQQKLAAAGEAQSRIEELEDDVEDLRAEIRDKDRALDERDDELEALRDHPASSEELQHQLQEQLETLQEKELAFHSVKDALREAQSSLAQRDKELADSRRQVGEMEDRVKDASKISTSLDRMNHEVETHVQRIAELEARERELERKAQDVQASNANNRSIETAQSAAIQEQHRLLEEKNTVIATLERKLVSAEEQREIHAARTEDKIRDLERHLQDVERSLSAKSDDLNILQAKHAQLEEEGDEELLDAQDRIHELELELETFNQEIAKLRALGQKDAFNQNDLAAAQEQIKGMERLRLDMENHAAELQNNFDQLQTEIKGLQLQLNTQEEEHVKERESWASRQRNSEEGRTEPLPSASTEDVAHLRTTTEKNESIQHELRQKIQDLEDDIEVLQSSADEDLARARDDITAMRAEVDAVRRQLRETQHDLARSQSENVELVASLESSRKAQETPSSRLQSRNTIQKLEQHLDESKQEKLDLQQRLNTALLASTSQIHDTQTSRSELVKLRDEKQKIEDKLAATSAELTGLKNSIDDEAMSRSATLKQTQAFQAQLRSAQRDAELKQQSQSTAYEHDIQNLEQDLDDANNKLIETTKAKVNAERSVVRLKTRIQRLEIDLAAVKTGSGDRETSVEERLDLHDMLKDAKLEAEDLAMQIKERDKRISSALSKEAELRAQLKRIRHERALQSLRADAASKELDEMQKKNSSFAKSDVAADTPKSLVVSVDSQALSAQQRRHAAELRGLARQIEYLGARCHREVAFRNDLCYIKEYFTKQVAMHARCTTADLKLVRAMGIQTQAVIAERKCSQHPPPSFKTVALMVLASVRMQRGAVQWRQVKTNHDLVVAKLQSMRKERSKATAPFKTSAKKLKAIGN